MLLIQNFVQLFVESAPWLLLGLFFAGLMKVLVPSQLLAKHLGEPGLMATVKAALLGAPLPLCSCGVIPAALALRRSGASKAATASFLISTPETGVDSVSVSYALLGPFMAVIRPVAAIASAIVAGMMIGHDKEPTDRHPEPQNTQNCCASPQLAPEPSASDNNLARKDATAADHQDPQPPLITQLRTGLRFTFVNLVGDIAIWLLIGLSFAAAIKTYVPNEFLAQWGDSIMAFIVMAAVGVPMYICALASTPIAAGLMFSGVSPGATLVFMLVGPATNIATIGLVKTELGNRALAAYLTSVVGVSFAFGYLTNFL
ncbi:MAG: SO_0444 family Cu/Zn efflux transporter, partial [Cellvibrionales bacterium]